MARAHPLPPVAHLVRVDLVELARHLTDRDGRRRCPKQAAAWLTQAVAMPTLYKCGTTSKEFSPFRETDTFGVFYTEENPAAWLEDSEIVTVREVPPTRKRATIEV